MAERITITMSTELVRKVRNIQAKQIREMKGSVSFSKVLSQIVTAGLKQS